MVKFGRFLLCGMVAATLCVGVATASEVRTVIPLGQAVGIKLFSDGVVVVGMSSIQTDVGDAQPAKDAGLKVGDIVTHINGVEVDTIESVQQLVRETKDEPLALAVMRSGRSLQLTAIAAESDGEHKLGLWLRDSMAGIGTLTFYDPQNATFGALGHGINDADTAQLMPLQSGGILFAEVVGVNKGTAGNPGELQGSFDLSSDLGELKLNTSIGIYGSVAHPNFQATPVPVATKEEVVTGAATILCNVRGTEIEEFAVEISQIYPDLTSQSKNMMLEVTDPILLDATGGIVQGMSGSPILQNGKIIGAVTHVFVNDPTKGYGIFIENMLETADSIIS